MKSKVMLLAAVATTALLLTVIASACGGGVDESVQSWTRQESGDIDLMSIRAAPAPAPAPTAVPAQPGPPGQPGNPGNPGPQAPMAQAAPAAPAAKVVLKEVEPASPSRSETAGLTRSDGSTQTQAQLVTQRRIIIRTVNMVIVVDEIQAAIDRISELADGLGGWVVSTDRREKRSGVISVRVPAEGLDYAIEALREMAEDVESEVTTSQDVTDEYFDLQSRLKNQQATEGALI